MPAEMLRNVILAVASGLFVMAFAMFVVHPETFAFLAMSGVLLLGTALDRIGYGRAAASRPAGHGWQLTAERFVDPGSGRLVAVWFDPSTGERRYVDDGPPAH